MALTLEHLAKSNRQVKRRKGESTEHYLQRLTHVSVICQKIAQIVRPSSLLLAHLARNTLTIAQALLRCICTTMSSLAWRTCRRARASRPSISSTTESVALNAWIDCGGCRNCKLLATSPTPPLTHPPQASWLQLHWGTRGARKSQLSPRTARGAPEPAVRAAALLRSTQHPHNRGWHKNSLSIWFSVFNCLFLSPISLSISLTVTASVSLCLSVSLCVSLCLSRVTVCIHSVNVCVPVSLSHCFLHSLTKSANFANSKHLRQRH